MLKVLQMNLKKKMFLLLLKGVENKFLYSKKLKKNNNYEKAKKKKTNDHITANKLASKRSGKNVMK